MFELKCLNLIYICKWHKMTTDGCKFVCSILSLTHCMESYMAG